jgi:hypothetical protein
MRNTTRWLLLVFGFLLIAGVCLDAYEKHSSVASTVGTLAMAILLIVIFYVGASQKIKMAPIASDLLEKQRICVRQHNLRVLRLILFLIPCTIGDLFVVHRNMPLGFALFALTYIILFYVGLVVIRRADNKYCYKIGFICPHCGKSLYYASDGYDVSILITRGECPSCKQSLV